VIVFIFKGTILVYVLTSTTEGDGSQIMIDGQMNNQDERNFFWTKSYLEDSIPSQIYNYFLGDY
jgi:hypothetical protein